MKILKKLFIIALIFIVASMVGCNTSNDPEQETTARPAASEVTPDEFGTLKRASLTAIDTDLQELHQLLSEEEYNIKAINKNVKSLLDEIDYCLALNPLPDEALKSEIIDDRLGIVQREVEYDMLHSTLEEWQEDLLILQERLPDIDLWKEAIGETDFEYYLESNINDYNVWANLVLEALKE